MRQLQRAFQLPDRSITHSLPSRYNARRPDNRWHRSSRRGPMSVDAAPVNTAKVTGRRKLRFTPFEELLAEVDRLSSGPAKTLGNWTPGQAFRHLALVYNVSIDGFTMTFPLHLRLMGKVFRKIALSMPMPAGFKLPSRRGENAAACPDVDRKGGCRASRGDRPPRTRAGARQTPNVRQPIQSRVGQNPPHARQSAFELLDLRVKRGWCSARSKR
jgi:hypothetical protein